jgi:alpha,alpha-trehalase
MCRVALDRAIALAGHLGAEDRVHSWAAARGEIRAAIAECGWNERAGAWSKTYRRNQTGHQSRIRGQP